MIGIPNQALKTIFSQKNHVWYTSKVKKIQKFIWGYPTKFAGSIQNPKKNYRNTKSTNRNKKKKNKVY
jgi:hypothetical protein